MRNARLLWVFLGVALVAVFAMGAEAQSAACCDQSPAFTGDVNFMSCAGFVRLQVYRDTGKWISLCEARELAAKEYGICGASFATKLPEGGQGEPVSCDGEPFSPPVNFMSIRGFTRYSIYKATGQWPTWEEVDAACE